MPESSRTDALNAMLLMTEAASVASVAGRVYVEETPNLPQEAKELLLVQSQAITSLTRLLAFTVEQHLQDIDAIDRIATFLENHK